MTETSSEPTPFVCDCDPELDPPADKSTAREAPGITFGELTRIFVDRRDVKFWQAEGPKHNNLYWVRAMLAQSEKEVEPPPQISRQVTVPQTDLDCLRFAQARDKVYSFLARAFEYPDDAFLVDITTPAYLEKLAAEFRQLADNHDVNQGLTLWQQTYLEPVEGIAESGNDLVGEFGLSPLREAYTRIIYDSNLPCIPPYESVYCNERQVMGKRAGAVAGFYREAGLSVEGNEMPDHIALECDFVAHLAGREADAWQAGQREEAVRTWETESRFLKNHLLSFGGKFCADLMTLARVDFYQAVARLGTGLFNDELIRVKSEI